MVFSTQNSGGLGSFGGLSTAIIPNPTPTPAPVPITPGNTPNVIFPTGGSSSQIIGTVGTGSTAVVNTGNASTVTPGNTTPIITGTGNLNTDMGERVPQTTVNPASPTEQTFFEKYKVWIIPTIAVLVIAIAMYFYFKK